MPPSLKHGRICPYSGEALDWHLIGTYDNKASRQGKRAYKTKYARLPTVDHLGGGLGEADFAICGWAVNDAKGDLSLAEFLALCKKVLKHQGLCPESVWRLERQRLEDARRYLKAIAKQWDETLGRLRQFVEG